jgi:hypothetical protein
MDNCCFNRPFDDQKQIRIKLETEAKIDIQNKIIEKKLLLGWSYILDFENEQNPFEQRKHTIKGWKKHSVSDINESERIIGKAEELVLKGIKSKDALHIACAIDMNCHYFLTTDDWLIKKGAKIKEIKIMDPISFIREGYE